MRVTLYVLVALTIGVVAGEGLTRSFTFRREVGRVVRQENLQALVGQVGIYDRDVEHAWTAELFASDSTEDDIEPAVAAEAKRSLLRELIAEEKLSAANHSVDLPAVDREMDLLRWQFSNEQTWNQICREAATPRWLLRRAVTRNLRICAQLETLIAPKLQPNESGERAYFAAHPDMFEQPQRFRVSHLFLAAPDGYPAEVLQAKKTLIESLSERLKNGESFPALVAQFSEDDATKKIGGDLNWFAGERMLPEVFAAAAKLQPGEISPPIRSRLGYHLLRLTSKGPPRNLSFAEVQPGIALELENAKRLELVRNFRGL